MARVLTWIGCALACAGTWANLIPGSTVGNLPLAPLTIRGCGTLSVDVYHAQLAFVGDFTQTANLVTYCANNDWDYPLCFKGNGLLYSHGIPGLMIFIR